MALNEQDKKILQALTNTDWHQVSGEEKDWISSEEMSYEDAMTLKEKLEQHEAQLWPAKSVGHFQVGLYTPNLTELIRQNQGLPHSQSKPLIQQPLVERPEKILAVLTNIVWHAGSEGKKGSILSQDMSFEAAKALKENFVPNVQAQFFPKIPGHQNGPFQVAIDRARLTEMIKNKNVVLKVDVVMNHLLDKNHTALTAEYEKLRDDKSIGWARAHARTIAGVFTSTAKKRNAQISDLAQAFERIKNNGNLSATGKTEATYSYLLHLQNELGNDKKSALYQLCDQYLKQIEYLACAPIERLKSDPSRLQQGQLLQKEINETKELTARPANKKKF